MRKSNLHANGDMNVLGSLTVNGPDEENLNGGKLHVKGELNISNDVGDYTIVVQASSLVLKDNHTGKLYEFVLKEIK
tara:strand:+ start:450 stop:680 length:231 start_codon:yes stop_codon:yes gene_type:complete